MELSIIIIAYKDEKYILNQIVLEKNIFVYKIS